MAELRSDLSSGVSSKIGIKSVLIAAAINLALAAIKALAGIIGHSYALVADAIESSADVLTSLVVVGGLKMAGKPPDHNHPYGHGKFEPLAAAVVGLILIAAAVIIAIESIEEILTPHHAPEPFTLIVLVLVVAVKEGLASYLRKKGRQIKSSALRSEAFHHRSDALTSLAAFIGITVAITGGPGYESADDYAALIAAIIIVVNAVLIMKPGLSELLDTAPDPEMTDKVRRVAEQVPGVFGTHNCTVRKVGFDYYVTLDVLCGPEETIRHGHDVAHAVGEAISSAIPEITKVLVHIEPHDDFGRNL